MKNSELLSNMLLDGFNDEDTSPLDIKFLIHQYLKYWWLFLLGTFVFISAALVYLFFSTPQYMISSSLLIKVDKGIGFTKNAVFSDLADFESTNKLENELEVLGSFSLMRDAIEDLPLHASYFVEDKFSIRKELYGSQVPVEIVVHERSAGGVGLPGDGAIKVHLAQDDFTMEFPEENYQKFTYGEKIENWYGVFSLEKLQPLTDSTPQTLLITLNDKDQLSARFSSNLQLELSSKFASVVNLSLTDPVPERGKDILNKLVEVYNFQAVKEKNVIAKNTIEFIDEQLKVLTKDLDAIERNMEQYKRANNISDLSSELFFHVESAGEYEAQLSRNRTQVQVLGSIADYLKSSDGLDKEVTSSLTIEDKTLASLVGQFNQMQKEKERLLRTVQPTNPLVINLKAQLSSLKDNILTNLANIKKGLEIENNNLQSRVSQLNTRARNVPEIERGLLELTREHGVKEEHYLYLVKKREESELSLAATTVSNSRIVDAASSSAGPVEPNKALILGFAFIMGLGLPLAFIYLKDAFSGKLVQKHEVRKITSIPIVAEISHNDKKEILAISEKRRTPIAEQFRLLRTNLKFINNDQDDKVILITSSISGEGKTFFSLNLGVSLSLTRKKVVILEFDLRKPALLDNIFVKRGPGITDFLTSDKLCVNDLIINFEPVSNLYVIGCGEIPEDPAELMLSQKVGQLINELKEKFDYVILDTAPVGTVADAFNLVPYIDYSLFLIRYNFTTKAHIHFFEEADLGRKLKKPLIVMNDAKVGAGHYGYSYGYGYEEKKKVYS